MMYSDAAKKQAQTEWIYKTITSRIIQKMEEGVTAWRGWQKNFQGAYPINYVTKKSYSGINALRLMMEGRSPWWLSQTQIEKLHGTLRKDARSVWVVGIFAFEYGKNKDKLAYRAVQSEVFNLDDTDNIRSLRHPFMTSMKPIEACERFIKNLPSKMPSVKHGGDVASYNWKHDKIYMPPIRSFESMEDYYAVLFHEYAHSTGHHSRLDRKWPATDTEYAFEELVAELTACFVCSICGISQHTEDSTATYLTRWSKMLRQDPRQLVIAASYAQHAGNFLQGKRKRKISKEKQAVDTLAKGELIVSKNDVKLAG